MEKSDNELVELYRNGSEEALAILIKRYLQPLYFFCVKMVKSEEAGDMVQETFVKVWKNLDSFDNEKSFKVWIYRIARNTCLDYLRKRQPVLFSDLKNEEEQDSFEETLVDLNPSALELLEREDRVKFIDKAIGLLPPASQVVFELYYREQMTFQEVAETLSLSINTVKSRHLRGLKLIKERLENGENSEIAPKQS